jgi:CubicO group peptidase (beta-lactamase class C family)
MKRNWKIRVLTVAALSAFGNSGCNGASQPTSSPEDPAAQSVEPSPGLAAPSEPLTIENAAYEEAAAYSARHGGLALVVIEGDRTTLAIGQNDQRVDDVHPLHGASESFWGPAAIAADLDGLLDLDEPVAFTIQEWVDTRWKSDMRIRQLLQYTSGLESGVLPLLRANPDNHYERALTLGMVAAPGVRFQVGPSHLAVLGEVLRRKLAPEQLDALAYLEREILDPIGLQVSRWDRDATGNLDLANGAHMSASEWAKFGVMIRDRGYWRGESVVDATGLEACLQPGEIQPRFGLTFWLDTGDSGTKPEAAGGTINREVFMAAGAGNQRLYVIRSLNLVVARFGEEGRDWRDPEFLSLITAAAQR